MVDVKFHCQEKYHFRNNDSVHGFTYKNYSIEMHSHEFYEVNIVLSGTGIHCIDNCKLPAKTGDVFVIPPTVAHAYIDTEQLEVYHILLQKNFMDQNKAESVSVDGFLRLTEIEPFLRSNSATGYFLHLSPLQLLQLKNELAFLDDDSTLSQGNCCAMKYHTAWKILYWFSFLLKEQLRTENRTQDKKYDILIIDTLEFIHKHYAEKITVDTLCERVFLSRSTFLRTFSQICDTSPIAYLNRYRCKKAVELLELAEIPKTEIAHSCGFYDLSHMERMLKKQQI